jgi:hypothetical protein
MPDTCAPFLLPQEQTPAADTGGGQAQAPSRCRKVAHMSDNAKRRPSAENDRLLRPGDVLDLDLQHL